MLTGGTGQHGEVRSEGVARSSFFSSWLKVNASSDAGSKLTLFHPATPDFQDGYIIMPVLFCAALKALIGKRSSGRMTSTERSRRRLIATAVTCVIAAAACIVTLVNTSARREVLQTMRITTPDLNPLDNTIFINITSTRVGNLSDFKAVAAAAQAADDAVVEKARADDAAIVAAAAAKIQKDEAAAEKRRQEQAAFEEAAAEQRKKLQEAAVAAAQKKVVSPSPC